MGIRFYCPDCGRRLNIKAFLAGKRGICPHCDSRVLIPMESQLPADAPKYRPTSDLLPTDAASQTAPADSATATADRPDLQPKNTAATDVADPIAASPDSVWYVRPTAGGQYGPARGDVMRRWVEEGRVSADSMVWQEGWADWKLAGPVFPSLDPVAAAAPVSTNRASATSSASVQPAMALQSSTPVQAAPSFLVPGDEEQDISKPVAAPARKVTPRKKSVLPLVILGLLIVVLLVVTVIILRGGGS